MAPLRDVGASYLFENGSIPMLYYAIVFAVLALLAGVLGFTVLGGTLAWVAKSLLIVFVVLFVLSLIFGGRRKLTL